MNKPPMFRGKPFDPNPASPGEISLLEFLGKNKDSIFTPDDILKLPLAIRPCGKCAIYNSISNGGLKDYLLLREGNRKGYLLGHPSALKRYRALVAAGRKG